jgi:hypothetical protein
VGGYAMNKKEFLDIIPSFCPFCEEFDGVVWTEFEVFLGDKFYFDSKDKSQHFISADMVLICTRCDDTIELGEHDLSQNNEKEGYR